MNIVPHILIADDQEAVRELCASVALRSGYRATGVGSGHEALQVLNEDPPDAMVCDLALADMPGLELLRRLKQVWPLVPVLVMTASASVANAVEAMKMGAMDYITKPFELDEMRLLLEACVRQSQLEQERRGLRLAARAPFGSGSLIGVSPQMQRVFRLVAKVAQSRYSVLILGESGTGKEVVARALHYAGPERDKPFIPVDCSALVPTLIESELFGYVKGAFTGAVRNHEGLLEVANGGTVFLDEIGELPIDLQAKLLRAIQEKEIRPVGGSRRVRVDARIVAATNRDLQAAVANGSFRKDLFFRLNVVSIKLPPLRERTMDLPPLVEHFLDRAAAADQRRRHFSDAAMARLLSYSWPGNVRELENCVERAVALGAGPQLEVADLPSALQQPMERMPVASVGGPPSIRAIAEMEREAILNALTQLQGDKIQAAKLLGIGKTTLYRKLKEYAFTARAAG